MFIVLVIEFVQVGTKLVGALPPPLVGAAAQVKPPEALESACKK